MFSINPYTYAKLPYHPVKDFTFIAAAHVADRERYGRAARAAGMKPE